MPTITQQLFDALSPEKEAAQVATGSVSLHLTRVELEHVLNQLVNSSGGLDAVHDAVITLSKSGNGALLAIDSVMQAVGYYIDKLQEYEDSGYFKTHLVEVVRAMAAKAKTLVDSLPSDLEDVKQCSEESMAIIENVQKVVLHQLTALKAATAELEKQIAVAEEITDEDQRKKASLEVHLSTTFQKVLLKDGLFSKATLNVITSLMNIKDTSSSTSTTAPLDLIRVALKKAQLETHALEQLEPILLSANMLFASTRIAFAGIGTVFSGNVARLISLLKIEGGLEKHQAEIDWTLLENSFPNLLIHWKSLFNSLARNSIAPSEVKPLASANRLTRRYVRNNKVLSSSYPTARTAVRSLALTATTDTPRARIKAALAPEPDATQKVVDLTDNILLVKTKVVDMRTRLSQSQWAQSLTDQVVEFEKNYNALQVRAKTLAGQIAFFGGKNIKVLNLLKASAEANKLTVEEFQKDITYLEAKVKVFVTASSEMTLDHMNLKTDMGKIGGALVAAQNQLNELIPQYEKNLQKAQDDLSKEQDKQKRAGILRAVGQALSTIGGGGSMLGVLTGNLYIAGFSVAAQLVGTALNIVAALTDGDANLITQLQAQIAQLKVQIPDMKLAQDAMQPCIDDSTVIQTTLKAMSDTWQLVTINLNNIDRDYKSWLDENFELSDFLLDVDDDISAWNTVVNALQKLAAGADDSDRYPDAPPIFNNGATASVTALPRSAVSSLARKNTPAVSQPQSSGHAPASSSHQVSPVSTAKVSTPYDEFGLSLEIHAQHFITSSYKKWLKHDHERAGFKDEWVARLYLKVSSSVN